MSELVGAEWTLSTHKRALDLIGITALMPLFVPAGALIATKIRSEDSMNPIFSQTRYGLEFEPFTFHKFRTMPPGTAETPSNGSADARRTAFGVKLSGKHLDEMPQAINIYNGTMSMVGPRALIWQDIEHTFDLLSPPEQKDWKNSRRTAKPGEFGEFQLVQHIKNYIFGSEEESIVTRAYSDIEYARKGSFRVDMDIILRTALAAYNTFRGKDGEDGHLRGESGARMFEAVASGFGVTVTAQEHEWWRATLLAARCLDDIVDDQGAKDLTTEIANLLHGRSIAGMTEPEAEAFREIFQQQPIQTQQKVVATYMALPEFALFKRSTHRLKELMSITREEADLFASMLYLEQSDVNRARFNKWLQKFAQTGYLADLVLDSKKDYDKNAIVVQPTILQRTQFGIRTVVDSGKLLKAAPTSSYGQLARGALKTLFL